MVAATRRMFGDTEELALGFYRDVVRALLDGGVPFIVGGGFAFTHHTGIRRRTKDLDLFVRPQDADWALGVLNAAGFNAGLVAPHWLAKVWRGHLFIDLVFSSGNGVAVVDDDWFRFAVPADLLGARVLLSPVEEMIWSKAYVIERERYDGADVIHLMRAHGEHLDWERLLRRFDGHWHVLMSHVVLFRFVYPSHRDLVPRWLMRALLGRMQRELETEPPARRLCRGTLLSGRQFLVDIEEWGYDDARLDPTVQMTAADIAQLTRSIKQEEAARGKGCVEPGRGR